MELGSGLLSKTKRKKERERTVHGQASEGALADLLPFRRVNVLRCSKSLSQFRIFKIKLLYEDYKKGCATLDYRAAISGIISQAVAFVPWLITNMVLITNMATFSSNLVICTT